MNCYISDNKSNYNGQYKRKKNNNNNKKNLLIIKFY